MKTQELLKECHPWLGDFLILNKTSSIQISSYLELSFTKVCHRFLHKFNYLAETEMWTKFMMQSGPFSVEQHYKYGERVMKIKVLLSLQFVVELSKTGLCHRVTTLLPLTISIAV